MITPPTPPPAHRPAQHACDCGQPFRIEYRPTLHAPHRVEPVAAIEGVNQPFEYCPVCGACWLNTVHHMQPAAGVPAGPVDPLDAALDSCDGYELLSETLETEV